MQHLAKVFAVYKALHYSTGIRRDATGYAEGVRRGLLRPTWTGGNEQIWKHTASQKGTDHPKALRKALQAYLYKYEKDTLH